MTLPGDLICLVLLTGLTALAGARLVRGGTIVGQDAATQFYPWYGYLGERLRQGELPYWNPSQFAGAPFIADPQSGWTYLPAMILFTLLPLATAANAYLILHLALAGGGAYLLARAIGLHPLGALTAALAYEWSGLVYGRSVCCPAPYQVAVWLPWLLLGAELALRRRSWPARARWWGLAGLALSQILASWIGQVSYYALLLLAAYLGYRTLIDPAGERAPFRRRFGLLILHGGAILAVGFGLAAAGILPRLEYNRLSNVAGGEYAQAAAAVVGGWAIRETPFTSGDFSRSLYYPGGAVVALALAALFVARGRLATPFFLTLSLTALLLAANETTPVHRLFYLLPRFEELHRHWPERVAIVAFLGPALLAGAVVSELPAWMRRRRPLPLAAILPLAIVVGLAPRWPGLDLPIPWPALASALATIALLVVAGRLPRPRVQRLLPLTFCAVIAIDLFAAGPRIMATGPYGGFHRIDLASYFAPSGAVRFLQERQAEAPSRFFGFDPSLAYRVDGYPVFYRYRFADPHSTRLIVTNRASLYGLDDLQGYNPVQLQRYVDYLNALNGHPQEYHDANVFPGGLDSPLLDLLNARHIVVPADYAERDGFGALAAFAVVYRDAEVAVLENPRALPRAWLVHAAEQVSERQALSLLATGAVDPRRTALLTVPPPPLSRPVDPSLDHVSILAYEPERLRLATTTSADALLVLSEMAYPGWQVVLDGRPAETLTVDYLLRAVAVPSGSHVVEFRYESEATRLGLAITLSTITAIAGLGGISWVGAAAAARRRSSRIPDWRPAPGWSAAAGPATVTGWQFDPGKRSPANLLRW